MVIFIAERSLEDHEDILAAHHELQMFSSKQHRRFSLKQDFMKYEFFITPKV